MRQSFTFADEGEGGGGGPKPWGGQRCASVICASDVLLKCSDFAACLQRERPTSYIEAIRPFLSARHFTMFVKGQAG